MRACKFLADGARSTSRPFASESPTTLDTTFDLKVLVWEVAHVFRRNRLLRSHRAAVSVGERLRKSTPPCAGPNSSTNKEVDGRVDADAGTRKNAPLRRTTRPRSRPDGLGAPGMKPRGNAATGPACRRHAPRRHVA